MTPTTVVLQLVDRLVCCPVGIVEDMLFKVGKFYFSIDFLILDMKEDISMPIILGKPLLATGGLIINVPKGKVTLNGGNDKEEFNVFYRISILS